MSNYTCRNQYSKGGLLSRRPPGFEVRKARLANPKVKPVYCVRERLALGLPLGEVQVVKCDFCGDVAGDCSLSLHKLRKGEDVISVRTCSNTCFENWKHRESRRMLVVTPAV